MIGHRPATNALKRGLQVLPPTMSCSRHDKVKLDIFWLKDDTLEDSADLPDPDVLVKIMRKKCKADSLPLQL
jgi:hypothetical protein